MKKNLQNRARLAFAILAGVACCGTARADLGTETTSTAILTSWMNDPNGNAPFYEGANIAVGTFSGDSQPAAASGASYTVLSETFSISSGSGATPGNLTASTGASNYVLTGIGMLISGAATNVLSIHLFDVTSNLNGAITSSSVSYDFTANGDLLGGGNGLAWVNNTNAGAEQQVYLPLTQGPSTYDQVVLGAGHIYALEVWTPVAAPANTFLWWKSGGMGSGDTDLDAGGLSMGSGNASFTSARNTISALGQVGSAEHNFGLALYATSTTQAFSTNYSTNSAPTTNYVIDDFNAYGYGPANPYVGTADYSTGGIGAVWTNWFGAAFVSTTWDPTHDAGNNPNSGSLKITANFAAADGTGSGTQFEVFDNYTGINPPLNALVLGLTSFQCDVLFDPSSATQTNSGVNGGAPFYGTLVFGTDYPSPTFTSQDYFPGSFTIAAGTTNWTHISIPLNPVSDPNLESINDVLIHIFGPQTTPPLVGTSILYVDNIQFVGPATIPVPPPPPTLHAQKAVPGLRIFAASTANTYDRQELDTENDGDESWVNGSGPVSYSFTLQDFPVAPGMQCHLFLVPTATLPAGNNPTDNEYVDYQASNNVWLYIDGGGLNTNTGQAGYTVSLLWKTNLPNVNAPNQSLETNGPAGGYSSYLSAPGQSPVGTWTLTFNTPTTGTLTVPPGVGPNPGMSTIPFNITDANAKNDFAPPVEALIGLQPNSQAGEGTYIDYARISITGTPNPVSEDFTQEAPGNSITTSGYWDVSDSQAGANTTALQLVTSATPLWLYWNLPDVGFQLGETPLLPALPANFGNMQGNIPGYVLPGQYNGYEPSGNIAPASRAGGTNWTLVPSAFLPSNEYPNLTNAYFILANPPPPN